MHELSIMESVINIVRESSVKNHITKVNKLKLVVGRMSMALPDSLQFAFQALGQDDLFQGAVLEIEERDIVCQCNDCQQQFQVDNNYCFICPGCTSAKVDIIQGRELYLDYFEGDEN